MRASAGGGGTDILDGGEGNDTNSFVGIGGDVTASLVDGTASYGMVNETFTNFENLTGSVGNDTLTGDAAANVLDGAAGDVAAAELTSLMAVPVLILTLLQVSALALQRL